jgi:hypothetical protein
MLYDSMMRRANFRNINFRCASWILSRLGRPWPMTTQTRRRDPSA